MPHRSTRHNICRVHNALALSNTCTRPRSLILVDLLRPSTQCTGTICSYCLQKWTSDPISSGTLNFFAQTWWYMYGLGGGNIGSLPHSQGYEAGLPLSPFFFFAIAIEPLANWVRGDPLFRWFEWRQDVSDDIALYADGVLIFLEDSALRPFKSSVFLVITLGWALIQKNP